MDKQDPQNQVKELLIDKNIQFYVLTIDDFNRECIHIVNLIRDSYLLFTNGSYSTSVFLSITAIEEIVKLHIGVYRREPIENETRRKKSDGLFSHRKKHILASIKTLKMGDRLNEIIGDAMIEKFINDSQNGELLLLREAALYCEVHEEQFKVPMDAIDKKLARIILLIAIEIWDDSLVGYSELSLELREQTDGMFKLLKTDG